MNARWITWLMTVLLTAMPALAQEAARIPNAATSKRWGGTLLALGLMVAIAVAGFMTPKRGHQD